MNNVSAVPIYSFVLCFGEVLKLGQPYVERHLPSLHLFCFDLREAFFVTLTDRALDTSGSGTRKRGSFPRMTFQSENIEHNEKSKKRKTKE